MSPETLRKKYPKFFYKNFGWEYKKPNLNIWFDFLIERDFKFRTKITIKKISKSGVKKLKTEGFTNLIFHLGLIEMLNYWKLTSSREIVIKAGNLDTEEKRFLRKIILKGMGEYFYKNKIDFTKKGFLKIKTNTNKKIYRPINEKLNPKKFLIPIGGGKDSPVVIEFLKRKGNYLGGFILNPKKPQLEIAKIAKLKEIILVERELDPLLFKLNKSKQFLNGHVPFSAFLSYLSLVLAYLFNYEKVAFGWEKSSDEPNLKYKKRWINHQWSKTSEFEKEFQKFAKTYLLKNIEVFSPLRKFWELEIAQIFSKLPQYYSVFLSCNNPYKIKERALKWCGKCPKCLFVFTALYPFLEEKKLIKIFGKNLFEDKKLLPLMLKLIGKRKFKPFECVGTTKESMLAFSLSLKKAQKKRKKIPYLLEMFEKNFS